MPDRLSTTALLGTPLPGPVSAQAHGAARFGRRVAERRASLHLTQDGMIKQLNRLTGDDLGRSIASVWENGHSEPGLPTIRALARVLETRPEWLAFGVRVTMPARERSRVMA